MPKEPWYESESERRWWWALGGRTVGLIVLCCILAAVLALGGLAWRYWIAGTEGKVQKQEIIQAGHNQLSQQARFEELFTGIKAYDVQIGTQADALAAHPQQDFEHDRLSQVVTGLKNQCQSAVAEYDALARTEQAEAFRAADLPPKIDTLDPTTDCKETHR